MGATGGEGGRQLGVIGLLPGFDFREFLDDQAAEGGGLPRNGLALGHEVEAAKSPGLCLNPALYSKHT